MSSARKRCRRAPQELDQQLEEAKAALVSEMVQKEKQMAHQAAIRIKNWWSAMSNPDG